MFSVGTNDPLRSSYVGSGISYAADGTKYFNSDAILQVTYPYATVACAFVTTANQAANNTPFSRTANNNNSSPYLNWGFQFSGSQAFFGGWGGGTFPSNSNSYTTTQGIYTSVVLTQQNGPASLYVQGQPFHVGFNAPYTSSTTQDAVCFSGNSNASAHQPFQGFVYYGGFWNRQLSDPEIRLLHDDPYCFLIYPEDEIWSGIGGAVVVGPSAVRTYRNQKLYPSLPRIDQNHPMADGLVFYGYDTGAGAIVDLVGGRKQGAVGVADPVTGSVFGSGIQYNADGSKYFASDAALQASYGAISFACGYVQTGTVGAYASAFMRTANNNASAPFVNWVFNFNPGGAGQNQVNMGVASTGGNSFQSANWVGNINGIYNVLVGTVSGSNWIFWANGQQVDAGAANSYIPVNTNDSVIFSGGSNAGTVVPFVGKVFWGAFWKRVLSNTEVNQLYYDPYCFLRFPENEIFDWTGGTIVAPVIAKGGTLPFMGVG
jgi:hypothetical protein